MKYLFKDGFTEEEIAIMYKVPYHVIKKILMTVKKPERI